MRSITGKLIRLNIFIFLLWYLVDTRFMVNNFLVSASSVIQGRIWTLLTSAFSHNIPGHLVINMLVFYGFGRTLEQILGRKRFLIFYLIAGVIGSFGHCLASLFLLHDPALPALGASGAISGVLVVFSLLFPTRPVFLMGLIPFPALLAMTIYLGSDLWGLIAQTRGMDLPIGFGAHLGGAFTGLAYYFFFLRSKSLRSHLAM